MDLAWVQQRPHLAPLLSSLAAVLKLADELHAQGRASGQSVDYSAVEEQVAHVTAKVEQGVRRIALSSLGVDAPFIRVWGNTISFPCKHHR